MKHLTINDVPLYVNPADADFVKRYADALEHAQKRIDNRDDNVRIDQKMLYECETVYAFFDHTFGDGTAQKVFLGRHDMIECIKALRMVVDEYEKAGEEYEKMIDSYAIRTTRAKR